ncbi:uncharacterized protein LOC135950899 [Calliphora vicina]|uniref:uncharacterized protein LOC135950899 n=1 Tax=Calliphora vicina TaxID=7373 RepID=UPI00325A8C6A
MTDLNDSGNPSTVALSESTNDTSQPRAESPASANVAVVYARLPLPQMASSNVESWFTTMDFWFTASGISSDKQKTATVLAALDPSVISQLSEVIAEMPQNERYDYIRKKIIYHFADSEQRRLNRLLSELPLGDKKPSELYYEMKRVAGSTLGDTALKSLWIKRLPDVVQPVVAASSGPATEFTRIADSIVDAVSARQINVISKHETSEIDELRAAVHNLTKKFEKFTTRSRSRSRHQTRNPSRIRARYQSPNNAAGEGSSNSTTNECWYHQKHGRNAQKCRSPCRHKRGSVSTVTSSAVQQSA